MPVLPAISRCGASLSKLCHNQRRVGSHPDNPRKVHVAAAGLPQRFVMVFVQAMQIQQRPVVHGPDLFDQPEMLHNRAA